MRILAELEIEDLEVLYELTYKYGWYESAERQEGWLSDQAYLQKAKIEHRLKDVTKNALDEMGDTYATWLEFHIEDGWIDAMEEHYIEQGMGDVFEQFNFWGILFGTEQLLYRSIAESSGGEQDFLEMEDPDYLLETYPVDEFLQAYLGKRSDWLPGATRNIEELLEVDDEIEIRNYIRGDEDRMAEFIAWIISDYGFNLEDYFRDNFTPSNLAETYSGILDIREYLRGAYKLYLERFPGLEEEIYGIAKTYEDVRNAHASDDLGEQILAFQLGLTTAHHHGVMADHLLELPTGEGQKVLDKLSSGPHVDQWNKEIERALGYSIT